MKMLLSFFIILSFTNCKTDRVESLDIEYFVTTSYGPEVSTGTSSDLNKYVEEEIEKRWDHFYYSKVSTKNEKSDIEIKRIEFSGTNYKITIREKVKIYEFELSDLTTKDIKDILNLRFSNLEELIQKQK